MNKLFKLLCSLPLILITLFYIPFLGIILIIFRYYIYKNKKYYSLPVYLIVIGFLILLPKMLNIFLKIFKIKFNLINISELVSSDFYISLLNYSKLLITVGIIFLIISFIFRKAILRLISKLKSGVTEYIDKYEKEQRQIREKNDLIIKERREIVKNTHLVHCPKCGADNTIVGKVGKCKFCRNDISYKE